jgi:hypothetical protein
VAVFAEVVFPDLEDHREEAILDLSDHSVLFRVIRALVLVIRASEDLLRLLEADASLRVAPQGLALGLAEPESHRTVV